MFNNSQNYFKLVMLKKNLECYTETDCYKQTKLTFHDFNLLLDQKLIQLREIFEAGRATRNTCWPVHPDH